MDLQVKPAKEINFAIWVTANELDAYTLSFFTWECELEWEKKLYPYFH